MIKRGILALAMLTLMSAAGQAGISYNLVTDQTAYTASTPGVVTVQLYLQETLTGGNVGNSLIAADGGLQGFALQVNRSSGTDTIATSGNTNNSSTIWSSSANGSSPTTSVRNANTQFVLGGGTNDPYGTVESSAVPDSNGLILLGTMKVNAVAGTTTFGVSTFADGSNVTQGAGAANQSIFNSSGNQAFYDLDRSNNTNGSSGVGAFDQTYSGIPTNYSFTVTVAVPEPSSMILSGLTIVGLAIGAYYRRNRKEVVAATAAI